MLKKISFSDKQSNINISSKYCINKNEINEIKYVINNIIDFFNLKNNTYNNIFKYSLFQLPLISSFKILNVEFSNSLDFTDAIKISSNKNTNLFYQFNNNIFNNINKKIITSDLSYKHIMIDCSSFINKNLKYYRYYLSDPLNQNDNNKYSDIYIYGSFYSINNLNNNDFSIITIVNNINNNDLLENINSNNNLINKNKLINNNSLYIHSFLLKNNKIINATINQSNIKYSINNIEINKSGIFKSKNLIFILKNNEFKLVKSNYKRLLTLKTSFLFNTGEILSNKNVIKIIPTHILNDLSLLIINEDDNIITSVENNKSYKIKVLGIFDDGVYIDITNNNNLNIKIGENNANIKNNILYINNTKNIKNLNVILEFNDEQYFQTIYEKKIIINVKHKYPVNIISTILNTKFYQPTYNNNYKIELQYNDGSIKDISDSDNLNINFSIQDRGIILDFIKTKKIFNIVKINKDELINVFFSFYDNYSKKLLYTNKKLFFKKINEKYLTGFLLLSNNKTLITDKFSSEIYYVNINEMNNIDLTQINKKIFSHMKNEKITKCDTFKISDLTKFQLYEQFIEINNNIDIYKFNVISNNDMYLKRNLSYNICCYSLSYIYLNKDKFNHLKRYDIIGKSFTFNINKKIDNKFLLGFKNIKFLKNSQILSITCKLISLTNEEYEEEFIYNSKNDTWIIKSIPTMIKSIKNIKINFLYFNDTLYNHNHNNYYGDYFKKMELQNEH